MILRRFRNVVVVAMLVVAVGAAPLSAARWDEPTELYKAYYLEHQVKDYAAAKKLYESLGQRNLSAEQKREAQSGANRCRDNIAAENFATLMPENALVYVELNRPGQVIEKLCGMLGLSGKDIHALLAQRPSAESSAPFRIPEEVVISPAVFEAFNGFGGGALAMTSFDPSGQKPPAGVLVIHYGDTSLLRGFIETTFQFSPTTEKIADMPTFASTVPDLGKVTGVLTEALFIVGTDRELVEGVADRLVHPGKASLGTREDLKEVIEQRTGATLFAYADLQAILKLVKANLGENDQREYAMANAMADLDSLRWATFSAGIHEGTMAAQLAVRLADNHHSLAYNLMRLPPMSRRSLAGVPAEAAGLFAFGLNPTLVNVVADKAKPAEGSEDITGLDIGREFFGNIREVSAFILPGKMVERSGKSGPPVIPNAGVILAVNDMAKSVALWDQFLSIPGLVGGKEPMPRRTVSIASTSVTAYTIPDFGKIYLVQLDDCIGIAATRTAAKSLIQAYKTKKTIQEDATLGKILAKMPKDTSMMFIAHVGRLAKVAGAAEPAAQIAAGPASEMCSDMVTWGAVGQSRNQMTLRMAMTGLPNLNKALKQYGPMITAFGSAAMAAQPKQVRGAAAKSTANVNDLTTKLMAAHDKKDYQAMLKYALEAQKVADSGLTNYNVACAYALLDETDKAFEHLFRAAEKGTSEIGQDVVQLMKTDADLTSLRDDPRFEKALAIAAQPKQARGAAAKSAPSVTDLTSKVTTAHDSKDYKAMLKYALEARKVADNGLTNYNVACAYALLGEMDKAFEHLFRAAEQGMSDVGLDLVQYLNTDTDLTSLRGDPRFAKVLAMATEKAVAGSKAAAPKKAEVRQEKDDEEEDE